MCHPRPNSIPPRPRSMYLCRGRAPALRSRRRAFTLVEALVAITIMALAGSVLLLAATSSLNTLDDALRRSIAEGLADQLINEIVTKRYMEPGESPTAYPFGPASDENYGQGRELYDDTDDFHEFSSQPPQGVYGEAVGSGDDHGGPRHPNFRIPADALDRFRQRIRVYYVDPADPQRALPEGQTSEYRAVEVAIDYLEADGTGREMALRRRVYAYIPPPP